ncbi:MAG: DUF192 domain-containing protein [Actinobacteria bacterium]|nr:DUF192 domain-containing protein [Actinomycetota bacterium]
MSAGEVAVINVTRKAVLAARAAVADTPRSRRRGLLGTEVLEDGRGLVIVPCRQVHTFGMRYAIDVVFVDRRMRVLRVVKAMRPCRLGALVLRAAAAIELPPGKAAATGTAPGDMLEIVACHPCGAEGARV